MLITKDQSSLVLIGVLLFLYVLECIFPFYDTFRHKTRHAVRNIGVIAFNAVVTNLALLPLVVLATSASWGLFEIWRLDWRLELLLTIVFIDILTYVMHVLFHLNPVLWRFHRMHHSDTEMDATSGARFHIGEHIISVCVRCGLYALGAMKLEFIVIYETVFLANVLFHHANLSMGDRLDRLYRLLLTSPDMHKVHHSNIRSEHDSNYTSLFSIWDRLFRTYKISDCPQRIVYGIEGLEAHQTIWRMLTTPFCRIQSSDASEVAGGKG